MCLCWEEWNLLWDRGLVTYLVQKHRKGEAEAYFVVSVFSSRSIDITIYQENSNRVSIHHYLFYLYRRKRNILEYIESSKYWYPFLSPQWILGTEVLWWAPPQTPEDLHILQRTSLQSFVEIGLNIKTNSSTSRSKKEQFNSGKCRSSELNYSFETTTQVTCRHHAFSVKGYHTDMQI